MAEAQGSPGESSVTDPAQIVVTVPEPSPEPPPAEPPTQTSETSPAEAEGEKGETAEEAAAKKAKGNDRLQKRFSDLTRTIYEERAAREAAERRLAELEGRNAPPSPGGEKAPKLEDFENYEDFAEARARYVTQQELRRHAEVQAKAAAEHRAVATASEIRARWETGESEFRAKVDDYDEVLADPDVKFTEAMSVAILDSEIGPQIAYHLKKHPEEALALRKLNPVAAARAVGKLEAKLMAAPPERPRTQTPAPPNPVTAQAPTTGLSDKLSDAEWISRRNKQALERRMNRG